MRIRTIKPEFFVHEGIFAAEIEEAMPLRVAFAGLWCAADREGRFKWEPRRLGVQILPYDLIDFSRVLHALTTRGFIVKYRVGNDDFGVIPSFTRHQVINNREKASDLPEPLITNDLDACSTRAPRVPHACTVEGKGKEREGMEGKGESARPTPPAGDWKDNHPTETAKQFEACTKRINSMHPKWRTALVRTEMDELQANAAVFFDLTDNDWNLLRAYMDAQIPESLGKFWQPDHRSQFIRSITDILTYADKWKVACKKHGIPTGLETAKAS